MYSNRRLKNGMDYENLIRPVFNCRTRMRNGAHLCFMQNAITMERGETNAKHLGSFEKQIEKVKEYLSKTLLKLSNTKPYLNEKNFFIDLENNLIHLTRTSELLSVTNLGLKKVS